MQSNLQSYYIILLLLMFKMFSYEGIKKIKNTKIFIKDSKQYKLKGSKKFNFC